MFEPIVKLVLPVVILVTFGDWLESSRLGRIYNVTRDALLVKDRRRLWLDLNVDDERGDAERHSGLTFAPHLTTLQLRGSRTGLSFSRSQMISLIVGIGQYLLYDWVLVAWRLRLLVLSFALFTLLLSLFFLYFSVALQLFNPGAPLCRSYHLYQYFLFLFRTFDFRQMLFLRVFLFFNTLFYWVYLFTNLNIMWNYSE